MKIPSTQMQNGFGRFLEMARREPVTVTKNGHDIAVLISVDEFNRLVALEDRTWKERAEKAIKSGFLNNDEFMELVARKRR